VRRTAASLYAVFLTLALPVAAAAQSTTAPEKPSGTDHTLTSIFVVAVSIPAILTVLTLLDIAVGKHRRHADH
jgi:ABC-type dipeptide/oligopeptide/nickel transport system permease component